MKGEVALLKLQIYSGEDNNKASPPIWEVFCKYMSGHKDLEGRIISPQEFKEMARVNNWVPYRRKDTLKKIRKHGGILAERKGKKWKDRRPVQSVKHPIWRQEQGTAILRDKDINPIYPFPESLQTIDDLTSGIELELLLLGGTANKIIEKLKDNPAFKIGNEFRNTCIEIGTIPSKREGEVITSLYTALQAVNKEAEGSGMSLLPISLFSHKVFSHEDITQDEYLKRMTLGHMTWEDAQHFIGESVQYHVGMTGKKPLDAATKYARLAPILTRPTSASPFGYGQMHPNLAATYLGDEKRTHRLKDKKTYRAIDEPWDGIGMRYLARWRGSPRGGVLEKPFPKPKKYFKLANRGMQNGEITSRDALVSPARVMGDHADIRARVDIQPNGTLEICNMDTSGGHLRKLAANEVLIKRLVGLLQHYTSEGKHAELAREFPLLFRKKEKKKDLRRAHRASVMVAKNEGDVKIRAANGKKVNASELFEELLRFVQKPLPSAGHNGLPPAVIDELRKSNAVPQEELYQQFKDTNDIISVAGFYETGVGTLSHWLRRRSRQLIEEQNISEEKAVENCMDDLARSYHEHLKKTTLQELLLMLGPNNANAQSKGDVVFTAL